MSLGWKPAPETNITGYRLYVGTQSQQYPRVIEAGPNLEVPVDSLVLGSTYYFMVKAINDGGLVSQPSQELAVTIAPQPVAKPDSYTANMGTPLVISTTNGVLANDVDMDSATIKSVLDSGPVNGSLTLATSGGFTYTPRAGYLGTDSFTYHVNDGVFDSSVVTVSINVMNQPTQFLVNGSFESGTTGWTLTGNTAVRTGAPYAPTQGTSIAAFNSGNLTPDGTLSQSFQTTVGDTYTLEFDAGILAYNTDSQSVQVAVNGNALLLSKTITGNGIGGGNTLQLSQKLTFVADSTLTKLTFTDKSTATNAIDLVIDNVRVTGPAPKVVQSAQFLVNGSFESGSTGWTLTGNTSVRTGAPYAPTQGTSIVAFNSGNLTPNGTLSQSFQTTVGDTYTLEFDAGILAYNTDAQSVQVTVNGNALLLSKAITGNGIGGGNTIQLPQKLTFVADSTLTKLMFTDKSTATSAIDFVVDNVRVTGPALKVVQSAQLLVNGSFESGITAWTATGNTLARTGSPYTPTQGAYLVAFNSGNVTPNGTLSQSFATVPAATYTLEFDAGVLAYNSDAQSLQVTVNGTALLLSKTITANGIGGGATLQLPQKLTFIADSALTTLVFTDKSIATSAIDVVLDNVRVTGPPASSTTTVTSTMVAKSAPVTTSTTTIGTPSLSMTSSNLAVRMSAAQAGTYIIERSYDLKNWTPVSSQVLTAPGLIEFLDTKTPSATGTDPKQTFYRVGRQ